MKSVSKKAGAVQLRDLVPNSGVAEPVPQMPTRPDGAPHVATYVSHSFELLRRWDSEDPIEIKAHLDRLLPVLPAGLANRFRWRPPKSVRTFGEQVDEEKTEAVADLLGRVADRPDGRCFTFGELAGFADRFWPACRQRTVDRMPSYDPARERAGAIPTRIYSRDFLALLADRKRAAAIDADPPGRVTLDGLERGPAETLVARVAARLEAGGTMNVRLCTLGIAPAEARGPLPPLADLVFSAAAVSAVAGEAGIDWLELLPWDVATFCAWFEANGFEARSPRRIWRSARELEAIKPHLEKLAWLDPTELRTEAFEVELRRSAATSSECSPAQSVPSFGPASEGSAGSIVAPTRVDPDRLPVDAAELYSSLQGGEEIELRMPDRPGFASRTTILLALMRAGFEPVGRDGNRYRLARPLELADTRGIRGGGLSPVTGYAERLSRKTGEQVVFCIDGSAAPDSSLPVKSVTGESVGRVEVGPYGGSQEAPVEPWQRGFGLPARATFELDSSLPSGVYTLDEKIPFVHRRRGPAPVAVLLPSNTAAAFNPAGGRRFYETDGRPPADVISFQRPLPPALLLAEYRPFVQWLTDERPFREETTYLTDSDLEESDALAGVEVLIVVGRSEYWTRAMRQNFDAFVDRGGRALLLCSEVMFWQVRVDLQQQRLYRYRAEDPHPDPLLRTTVWRDPSLRYPVYPRTGGERWHGGLNADEDGVGWRGMRIVTPDSPLLTESGLARDDLVSLPDAVNWDGAPAELGADGIPRVDFGDSAPWRHEVVGYNLARSTVPGVSLEAPAVSMWIVLRRSQEAGTVIHGGTMGWCGPRAIGRNSPHSTTIRPLILRMLRVLLDDEWPFSTASQ